MFSPSKKDDNDPDMKYTITAFILSVGQQRHFLAKLLRHFSPFSPFPHIQYAINNIQYAIAELIFLYQGWYLMGGGFCLKLYSAIELLVL